jgi:hypothetical protein
MALYAYVMCLRILVSLRISDMILGNEPLIFEVVLSQLVSEKGLGLNTHESI